MTIKASLLLLPLLTTSASAYTNGITELFQRAFQPKEELQDFSQTLMGTTLDMKLQVDEPKTDKTTRKRNTAGGMGISNLVLELQGATDIFNDPKKKQHHPMPGFDGPHPDSSSGVSPLQIVKPGHYIDLEGSHSLALSDEANWEVVWRENAPAGALICALDLQSPATRNQATLDAGSVYISFPLWTAENLLKYQGYKQSCDEAVAEHLKERDDQLHKMQETNNLLAKALHYRNAAAAVEKYSLQPIQSMSKVPTGNDVVPLSNDLFMARAGTVWRKYKGHAFMGTRQQVLLGTALLANPSTTLEP